jgi:hypothetical protein
VEPSWLCRWTRSSITRILASLAALPGEMTLMVFGRGIPVQ